MLLSFEYGLSTTPLTREQAYFYKFGNLIATSDNSFFANLGFKVQT
jgi:hypothetical protein